MSLDPIRMAEPVSVADIVVTVQTMRNFTDILLQAMDSNSYREDHAARNLKLEYDHFARKIGGR